MVFLPSVLAFATTAISLASAHPHLAPGDPALLKRQQFQQKARRSLSDCQAELSARGGVYERGVARRAALAAQAREAKALRRDAPYLKRDLGDVLNTDHHSNLTGVTNSTDATTLFAGNSSCVLGPETTQGPYYVNGEYVRWDIREDQAGVDMYTDIQLIDVNTCEPAAGIYVDFWHANATGVYSGVVAGGNGNSADESNLDKTWLRGLQATDDEGVAQWLSIFPGHYTSRATHVHILAHQNGTFFDNGTFVSDEVSHVGQIFYDQTLITEVELTEPYISNTQKLTTNEDDGILSQEAEEGIDPVVEYVYLGEDVTDGLMTWVALGIDTTVFYEVRAAATLTEDGGVANPNSGGGGGGPPPSGSGSASGVPPSASASA